MKSCMINKINVTYVEKSFLGPLDFGNTKQIFTLKILVKVTKKGPSTKEIRMWLKIGKKGS